MTEQEMFDLICKNHSHYKNQTRKEQDIWEVIYEGINDIDSENHQFWCNVMDLYHEKFTLPNDRPIE